MAAIKKLGIWDQVRLRRRNLVGKGSCLGIFALTFSMVGKVHLDGEMRSNGEVQINFVLQELLARPQGWLISWERREAPESLSGQEAFGMYLSLEDPIVDVLLFATRMYFVILRDAGSPETEKSKGLNLETGNDSTNHLDPRTSWDKWPQSEYEDLRGSWTHVQPMIADLLNFEDDLDILSRVDGGTSEPISSLVFFAGGKRIATSCKGDPKIRLWNVENDQLKETEPLIEHGIGVTSAIAASSDGKYIVSGHDHGKVMIWDVATHPSRRVGVLAMEGNITALDISHDSLRVASGSEDGTVVVWSIEKQECLVGPLRHQDSSPVESVKFSPTGGRIASAYRLVGGNSCSIRIWHSRTGAQLESIHDAQSTYSLAWSPDSRQLFAGGSNGSVKCFDVLTRTLHPEWRAPFRDHITSLSVSHNNHNQFLVSVSSGRARVIDVWDTRDVPFGEHLRSRSGVITADISLDDACLVSIGTGNEIALRSLSTIVDRSYLFYRLFPLTGRSEPFTYISNRVHEALKSGRLVEAEEALSKEIEDHRYRDFIQYGHANRALVRFRRRNCLGALEDADAAMSNNHRIPLIAYVMKGIALHGQGDIDGAMRVFESTLSDCGNDAKHFVECIKSITFLCVEDPSEVHSETYAPNDLPDINLGRWVMARKYFLLADRHMDGKDYEKVLELLEAAPDLGLLLHVPEANTISLIFNWDLRGLISSIHELRCRALFELGRTPGFLNYFSAKERDLSEELEVIIAELSALSEGFGDEAKCHRRYCEAIAWYTEALTITGCPLDSLPRCPQCTVHLLAKRSEAEAAMGLWADALTDANRAIEMDSLHPLVCHRRYVALHGMGYFRDASAALSDMFLKIKNFGDPEIRELRANYFKTLEEIDKTIEAIFDASPFVLIHVADGHLCDQAERIRRFKEDPTFYELVSSVSMVWNTDRIKEVVERYFFYVMFSHTWEETEPSFEDVSGKSVYDLQNEKLHKFCEMVRDGYKPYQWSWSDTCCINKKDVDVYQKSIHSMYKWYNNSALTLVRLAHPSKSNPPDSPRLEHNRWMFRAWTLQELLAPEVIRFYDHNWELYLHDNNSNHKTSPKIKPELARATGIEPDALVHFSPEALPVRQRLRLASTRKATVKVDIAYSLIGIFSSDIHVEYAREAEHALGLLLQERVNRQGDVTVLDWVGKPSKFHSSIPAKISVYSQSPYAIPFITNNELDHRVEVLKDTFPKQEVARFYNDLTTLELPRFADRRLSLPCITFSVTAIQPDPSSTVPTRGVPAYLASTAALGNVKFKTKDTSFSEALQGRVVLIYPWIRDLLTRIRNHGGDEYTRSLRLIVYLEQEFRVMLFMEQSHQQYKRVAADEEISVPTRKLTSLEDIGIEVLEIWEKS